MAREREVEKCGNIVGMMKSIYSIPTLQRILDHWGVGKITYVTYFNKIGNNIWRHFIETPHGEFELFSFQPETGDYSLPRLNEHLQDRHGKLFKKKFHCFDRYHLLLHLQKKWPISLKQSHQDLEKIVGSTIQEAFRVYGTIFQIHVNQPNVKNIDVLVSYGQWFIQKKDQGQSIVIASTYTHDHDQLDKVIENIEKDKPIIEKYVFTCDWFEIYLSNKKSLYFKRNGKFPAIELHLSSKKNNLLLFTEDQIYYFRSLDSKEKKVVCFE